MEEKFAETWRHDSSLSAFVLSFSAFSVSFLWEIRDLAILMILHASYDDTTIMLDPSGSKTDE